MPEPEAHLTAEDFANGQILADRIVEMIKVMRPPAAVAGCALALAAIAHLAQCGPDAAKMLFDRYFKSIDEAAATITVDAMMQNPRFKA